ncbi:MAG: helix-turn-helix domain-containing protein [Clostridia bacterium]|nr:helix-turn-helix domain-containing protein [Clostridia bacterium]
MEFGNRLKDLLRENNISQETLAKSIGVSQRAVSKWINHQAEPTESSIVNCAKYFEVSADFILGLTDIT